MRRRVWLSGRYVQAERARIPALNLTVLQGVGVFETLRLVGGAAPLLERHVARLERGCACIGWGRPQVCWAEVLGRLSRENHIRNGWARIVIGDRLQMVTLEPLPRGIRAERERGIELQTRAMARPAPLLKGTSRLSLFLAERAAEGEVLMVADSGRALETTRSNFFVVGPGGLETAPDTSVLPGVARSLALESARNLGLPVRMRAPRLSEAGRWRAAFVTNALRGLRPVIRVGATHLDLPEEGSITRCLQAALDQSMGLARRG